MNVINKDYIVRSNLAFDHIIKKGMKIPGKYFMIYYLTNKLDHPRFGVAVPKKLGNAVLRNKIRRQVKEILRTNLFLFENKDYIVVVGKNFINLSFNDKIDVVTKSAKKE